MKAYGDRRKYHDVKVVRVKQGGKIHFVTSPKNHKHGRVIDRFEKESYHAN